MTSRRPQTLVFTLFGEYLAPPDRNVWVGSLIALLRPFRLTEGSARTILSRLVKRRWLVVRKSGRHAYYALSARGQRLVAYGRERIFHPPHHEAWDGQWCLVTYSIPEKVRHLRDRLRARLTWLGFGSLGNGIWISPYDVRERVARTATDMGLEGRLLCFEARQVLETDPHALVARCWDLPGLAARYGTFADRWRAEKAALETALERGRLTDEQAFLRRFQLIHQYGVFAVEDPFLPANLLPQGWPGDEAGRLVTDIHELIAQPATRYVERVLAEAPPFRGRRVKTHT